MGRNTEERYDELVNRMLSEYLFIDRGYQLSAICRLLAQPDRVGSFGREDRKSNSATTESDRWITLNLQDSSGRQLAFTEVGSGLGYVLPVLTAACDFALPVAVLQQPELHLHPALQSKIGDVFVELASCASLRLPRRRLIVETHSEHLLLRILRRVRQTTANLGNPELRVRPDDLCVVYFDPQINGTTTVNRLRVSADGDFIDRWPRGFFDERDEDLFDE